MNSPKIIKDLLIFENERAEITVSLKDTTVEKIVDKKTGASLKSENESTRFFKFFGNESELLDPEKVTLSGDIVTLFFKGFEISIKAEIYPDFFTFELQGELPEEVLSAILGEAKYSYDYTDKNNTGANGVAMTYSVNPRFYPDAKALTTGGSVYRNLESEGAKYALIIAPIVEMKGIIQSVFRLVDKNRGIFSEAGGAFGEDFDLNYESYAIQTEASEDWLKNRYPILKEHSHLGGVHFHHKDIKNQGGIKNDGSFRQGDFEYLNYKDAAEFREKIVDVLAKDGVYAGLHCYSFYISYNATSILSKPENLKQLCIRRSYTLAEDIGEDDLFIRVEEPLDDVPKSLNSQNSPFLIIGDELMRYEKVEGGFKLVARGWADTKKASYKKGAEVKHVHGHYQMIAPDVNSELFLEIARRVAKAYNEGGYKAIYLDALDGVRFHCGDVKDGRFYPATSWFYCAKFICEILKHCDTTPVMEYSWIYPAMWAARGRYGAWDVACRGVRAVNKDHAEKNVEFLDRFGTSTLGWYCFYTQTLENPPHTNATYHHIEDIDYAGTIAVSRDFGNVYHITPFYLEENAGMRRNAKRYALYDRLRRAHYFSDEIREKLHQGDYNFKLIEKRGKKFAFVPTDYQTKRLYDINDPVYQSVEFKNPFGAQKPFIRIEPLLSTFGRNPITLLPLDETKDLTSQTLSITYPTPLNLSKKIAKKIRVLGNGKKGSAICIRLTSRGCIDHIIDTDFKGWREFTLLEADNTTRPDTTFSDEKRSGHIHGQTAFNFHYNSIRKIDILTDGDVSGVRMSSIVACDHVYDVLKNPTIKIGDTKLLVECEITSGDFLEYDGKKAVLYDRYANPKNVFIYTDTLKVPRGKFKATFEAESLNGLDPVRAQITFGFMGKELK